MSKLCMNKDLWDLNNYKYIGFFKQEYGRNPNGQTDFMKNPWTVAKIVEYDFMHSMQATGSYHSAGMTSSCYLIPRFFFSPWGKVGEEGLCGIQWVYSWFSGRETTSSCLMVFIQQRKVACNVPPCFEGHRP